jgi:chemotaxis protein MotB
MADKKDEKKELQPIIIKKKKGHGHGHHGGAWKVAYADFVTAMMAFFLLMWLLNATTQVQRMGIANYFSPVTVTKVNISGSGGVLGGTVVSPEGAMKSDRTPPSVSPAMRPPAESLEGEDNEYPASSPNPKDDTKLEDALKKKENEVFKSVESQLRSAVQNDAELQKMAENLMIDRTPEGLRIQILDKDQVEMFSVGSAKMYDYTQKILYKVAQAVAQLPNKISISGHTDGRQYSPSATYTNWELSSDRANAARRVIVGAGIPEDRIARVQGKADREHLVKGDPMDAKNRRLSIVLLTELHEQQFDKIKSTPMGTKESLFKLGPNSIGDQPGD